MLFWRHILDSETRSRKQKKKQSAVLVAGHKREGWRTCSNVCTSTNRRKQKRWLWRASRRSGGIARTMRLWKVRKRTERLYANRDQMKILSKLGLQNELDPRELEQYKEKLVAKGGVEAKYFSCASVL